MANALEDARPVTLALIQGGVYGGGTDLALACDFRFGTPEADMFMPAARLGLHFYPRGLERYVSRLGVVKEVYTSVDATDLQRDIASAAASADLREGGAAFAEKRAPRFTGR